MIPNELNMVDYPFQPEQRLRSSADFTEVYRQRTSVADGVLIVYGSKNTLGWPRLGLSVGRRVGNAVTRNRWKRVIREAFRLNAVELSQNLDLVVHPRPGVDPQLEMVGQSLRRLSKRVQRKLGEKSR